MKRNFVCITLCLYLLWTACGLDAEPNDLVLSGHLLSDKTLVISNVDIVVGKFISLGAGDLSRPGGFSCSNAQIEIDVTLRGSVSGRLVASYFVTFSAGSDKEVRPSLNQAYIMFLKKGRGTDVEIKKILPATGDNIAKIKALITAVPAGK